MLNYSTCILLWYQMLSTYWCKVKFWLYLLETIFQVSTSIKPRKVFHVESVSNNLSWRLKRLFCSLSLPSTCKKLAFWHLLLHSFDQKCVIYFAFFFLFLRITLVLQLHRTINSNSNFIQYWIFKVMGIQNSNSFLIKLCRS